VERAGQLHLRTLIADGTGRRVLRCAVVGRDPDALGADAAAQLRRQGADEILLELREGSRGADR
jgi:hypothetical protein